MKTSPRLFLALALVMFFAGPAAGASYDFVVIQPGQPGSPQDAQPVMDELAAYLSARLGVPVTGTYVNDHGQAQALMAGDALPAWSIMGLGFFLDHAASLSLTPLAATRPGGRDKDTWSVLVSRDAPQDAGKLSGEVQGSMLFDASAACLLFGPDRSVEAVGTHRPVRALRSLSKGDLAGVVVDSVQMEALDALPMAGDLVVAQALEDIPFSPVVWFGEAGPEAETLRDVLMAMADDPDAENLLALLQTKGFGPADPGLSPLLTRLEEARCE